MHQAHAAHVPGRVGPTKWGLGHFLACGFLCMPSSSLKSDALIFPKLSEAMAAAELLILSEGGQILLLRRCHIPNFGPIKISLSKTKLGFEFGSSDLGTPFFLLHFKKKPQDSQNTYLFFKCKKA